MTTRRTIPSDQVISQDDASSSPGQAPSGRSNTAPAVPASVILKLLGFTAAMVVAPLGTYYGTVNTVFRGSTTWAGATAAVMANVVLVAYVIVAMAEDQSDRLEAEKKERKTQ
ncbi:vacuolar ATPase assembly integral membrane protein vma21 [Thelotrema lepadinum]|nr:vacuolar ATPase assembly integral membrane protein vma21 [Thelotrema lepadinum]